MQTLVFCLILWSSQSSSNRLAHRLQLYHHISWPKKKNEAHQKPLSTYPLSLYLSLSLVRSFCLGIPRTYIDRIDSGSGDTFSFFLLLVFFPSGLPTGRQHTKKLSGKRATQCYTQERETSRLSPHPTKRNHHSITSKVANPVPVPGTRYRYRFHLHHHFVPFCLHSKLNLHTLCSTLTDRHHPHTHTHRTPTHTHKGELNPRTVTYAA